MQTNIFKITSFIFFLFLTSCVTYQPYNTYKAECFFCSTDGRRHNISNYDYDSIIFFNEKDDYKNLDIQFQNSNLKNGFGLILFIIPFPVPSNEKPINLIESSTNFSIFLLETQRYKTIDITKLKISLKKTIDSDVYFPIEIKKREYEKSKLIGVSKYKKEKVIDYIYTFPIKITDIGKEGLLVFEYNNLKKEVKFKYGTRWDVRAN